eukprot:SAG25_NODE_1890_length_2193_cov_1.644699_3_plen_143_part_00
MGAWARVFVHALSAELDYEEGRSAFEVTLLPDVFFLTSAELDFTMVAVAVPELRGRAPIPLREGLTIEPSTGQPGRSRCDHAPPTPLTACGCPCMYAMLIVKLAMPCLPITKSPCCWSSRHLIIAEERDRDRARAVPWQPSS